MIHLANNLYDWLLDRDTTPTVVVATKPHNDSIPNCQWIHREEGSIGFVAFESSAFKLLRDGREGRSIIAISNGRQMKFYKQVKHRKDTAECTEMREWVRENVQWRGKSLVGFIYLSARAVNNKPCWLIAIEHGA